MSETVAKTVRVFLNGKSRDIESGHTVRSLLESLDLHPGMVVVELNREILERDGYESTPVDEGDALGTGRPEPVVRLDEHRGERQVRCRPGHHELVGVAGQRRSGLGSAGGHRLRAGVG